VFHRVGHGFVPARTKPAGTVHGISSLHTVGGDDHGGGDLVRIGEASKIFLIIYTTIFIVILNTAAGVSAIAPNNPSRASPGATPTQIFVHVALPATLPYILTGMRLAMANSFTTIVAAELIAANEGLARCCGTGGCSCWWTISLCPWSPWGCSVSPWIACSAGASTPSRANIRRRCEEEGDVKRRTTAMTIAVHDACSC